MHRRFEIACWVGGAAAALALAFVVQDFYLRSVLNLMAIAALLGASLRFVMLMGELNFALAAFVGIGAYSAGYVKTVLDLPFGAAVLIAGIVTTLVSVAFGAITLRTRGPYFLLIGFAFTEAIRVLYSKIAALGGTSGMIGIFPARYLDNFLAPIVMAVVIMLLAVLYLAEHSDFGRLLLAIRENEDVVRSVGINTYICKVGAIALASFVAGIAGGLHAFVNSVISPGDFSYLLAAFVLAYVKVGGEDYFLGPIVGAVILVSLSNFALGMGGDDHLFYGGAIVLAMLLMPAGLVGKVNQLAGGRRMARGAGHGE